MSDTLRTDAVSRITEYLGVGGLFNPEILNVQQHEAVRDTLIQARDELTAAKAENSKLQERVKRLEMVMKNLVMELDAYLRPWNQPSKDPNNKAKRLDLAEDAARFEIKDVQ